MKRNSTLRKPLKHEDEFRKSTKPLSQDDFRHKLDAKEWNRRMKTWEMKREQLESGLKSSQDMWNKLKQQSRISYETSTKTRDQSKNGRVETNYTSPPRESAIENVNQVMTPNECRHNDFVKGHTEKINGEDKQKEIKKKNEERRERCDDQGEIDLVSKEHINDCEEGKGRSDSILSGNDSQTSSSQSKIRKNADISHTSSKGGLFLSPIPSVSENNFYTDGPNESKSYLESSNIKKPKVGSDIPKSEEPHLKQKVDLPIKYKLGENDFIESQVLVSLWACDQSVSNESQLKRQVVESLSIELPSSDSGNRKMMCVKGMSSESEDSGNQNMMSVKGMSSESEDSGNQKMMSVKGMLLESEDSGNRKMMSVKGVSSQSEDSGNRKMMSVKGMLLESESENRKMMSVKGMSSESEDSGNPKTMGVKCVSSQSEDSGNRKMISVKGMLLDSEDSGNRKMMRVKGMSSESEDSGNQKMMNIKGMSSESEDSRKFQRYYQKSGERSEVLSESKRRSSTSGCSCFKKSSDLTVILDKLFTVTKALNEQNLCRRFKKNHSKPLVFDDTNDRSMLNAIVCYPLGSPVDGIESLSSIPVLSELDAAQERASSPVIYESVASTPAEFYEKARNTTDRYLKRVRDGSQKSATRIEWYEGEYVPMSSEEMDTHYDVICDSSISMESYKETVVDRRKCRIRKYGHYYANRTSYDMRNLGVKRYEVHHDTSNCHLHNLKK